MSKPFAGVPEGRVEVTPLPNVIFSELLPQIDDLAELQITLHVFFLLYHKKGSPRFVTLNELRADSTLSRALVRNGQFVEENLTRGLERAEARGTLLHLIAEDEHWYFFNTAESRKAIEKIERGELKLNKVARRAPTPAVETPNIFKLYEQNIGTLTPLIAEELKEVEREFAERPEVIMDAFRIATENNVRKWSYVRAILLDGAREGKNETTGRDSKRHRKGYIQGKYSDVVKR
jgi:DnaD/phage-associated family protein